MTNSDHRAAMAARLAKFVDDHPEVRAHVDALGDLTDILLAEFDRLFVKAADRLAEAAGKPEFEKHAPGLRMASRVLRQLVGADVPSMHERLAAAGIPGELSAAYDMLEDAGFDMERASRLLAAAQSQGRDPQEFARHLIRLRRATGGGQ